MRWKYFPKYKSSGIDWLGDIPEQWDTQRLKFNSYIKGRIGWQNLRSGEFTDEGPYLITGMHFKDGGVDWDACYHITEDRYLMAPEIFVCEKDVLITKDGSIGKVAYINNLPGKASLNSHLLIIRPLKNAYDSIFMYYLLGSANFQHFVLVEQKGTTFYGITQESVENFSALLPPLPEQRAIAAFLDKEAERIDILIAKKERQIELLQEKRAALISHAVTKGLNPDAKMKDSGIEWLGEIPAHWAMKRLKHITQCLDGKRIPLNAEQRGIMKGDYAYWGANGIVDHVNQWLFNEELVLLGEDGAPFFEPFKDVAFFVSGKIWVNNHAHVLRPLKGINPRYLTHLLNSVHYRAFIDGSTRDKLTQGAMNDIPTQFPPMDEQDAITAFLDREMERIDALISKVRNSTEKLGEYRTALISAAVTGKIDVREEVA